MEQPIGFTEPVRAKGPRAESYPNGPKYYERSPQSPKGVMNPIHIVDHSPWPFLFSISMVTLVVNTDNIFINLALIMLIVFQWFRDIVRESHGGYHTVKVQKGISTGFFLFLISEIMLFFSFFWAFFHSSLAPSIWLGISWPPEGLSYVNPWGIPFLGSIILLSSGFLVTLSHHAFLQGHKYLALSTLALTCLTGFSFILLQFVEYSFGEFTISDSVFGSVFYMTTGLHAIHVIVGVFFLFVQYIR